VKTVCQKDLAWKNWNGIYSMNTSAAFPDRDFAKSK